jgi:DNA helicase-2/ATP-dependent DNA helicase PcrA
LLEIYKQSWIPIGYNSKAHQNIYKKRGEKMLEDYFKKMHKTSLKIVDLEKIFKIKIGDITVSGKIDRVDQLGGNEIEIIDYKTAQKTTRQDRQKELQLAIYLLAAIDPQLYAKKPEDVILSFLFLQTSEKVTSRKKSDDIEKVKSYIKKIVQDIRSIDWTSTKVKACNRCLYCELYSDTFV